MNLDVKCPKCFYSVPLLAIKTFEDGRTKPATIYSVCQCPRTKCKFIFFVRYPAEAEPDIHTFPSPNAVPDFLSDAITWTVREDIAEAYRCFHAHAFRAVIVMSRRCVQQVVAEKEAQGQTLFEKAENLFKRGMITESLKKALQSIKYFQPYGALPENDQLQYPTQSEAEDILAVVFSLLEDVYVRPNQVKQIAERKEGTSGGKLGKIS